MLEAQWREGPARRRVGLIGQERTPIREGSTVLNSDHKVIGRVTSGTVGPTVQKPIAMAYVEAAYFQVGTPVFAEVRGKALPMIVAALPFAPNRYYRG